MGFTLTRIIGVDPAWETAHRVRALCWNGRSPVLKELADLQKRHPEDYRRLMAVVRLVAENQRVANRNHVKPSKQFPGVFEMRGGGIRLFFFYTPDADEVVVCANSYWKAKPGRSEQHAAFERCARLRQAYLAAARESEG